jgi:beta-lactamase regulating signal transducer with metallopeptidase domain
MNLNLLTGGAAALLPHLALSAGRILVLALVAGIILRCVRPRSTAVRLHVWTAVLYAAFAIPLLGWLAPSLPIPTPAFLHRVDSSGENSKFENSAQQQFASTPDVVYPDSSPAPVANNPRPARSRSPFAIDWAAVASVTYVVVFMLLLLRFVVGLTVARRLVKRSGLTTDTLLQARVSSRALRSGLEVVPDAYESELVCSPVTIGVLRPMIFLPAGWREWEEEKLEAVIAHEMSHIRRRDGLTQCLALAHRAIFWFSPFSWWLTRHLANLAEQASDEAALSGGADRYRYAKTLLEFFAIANAAPGRVWWQGVAMGNAGQAEKRMERILAWRGTVAMKLKKSALIISVALAVLLVYVVAAARPVHNDTTTTVQSSQEPPSPAASVPAPPPASSVPEPASPVAPVKGSSHSGPSPVAPTDPASPAIPSVPAGPVSSTSDHGSWYGYGFDDEERFVIVTGKSDSLTMSGSSQDARHVEKLRKQVPGDFIWFQRDEKSYIIRDQATIDRARQLWAPQQELGKKQAELGKQQAALGKQQAELGAKMRQVQVKVPDMTAELDKLRAELKQLSSGASAEQVSKLQAEMGELQAKLGSVQAESGEQQSRLGAQMGELGEKQGALGKEQGELGRQQGELARRASEQMKSILDEALKKGLAQPEPETRESSTL